ncbi:MAG: ATP-binding cassette domain-containing protein [Lachnospiraceae bacterium]|nr:ATP-binding cassette domain-containing protein [Lachnospiraceae bacterium]
MIQIKNLNLNIKGHLILSDVNMTMQKGKIYGLVGNNGSGKTMLMKCICGFIHPTSGEVIVNDEVIGRDADYIKDAGIIIENPGFIPYYSGMKNLRMLSEINGTADKTKIRETMEICGLNPELKLPVKKYSLGMRQRLGIAQAIMEEQSVLILDEPMNGLDKEGVAAIRELLLKMKEQGRLIILASHNREDIDVLCDEVFEVEKGKIREIIKGELIEYENFANTTR